MRSEQSCMLLLLRCSVAPTLDSARRTIVDDAAIIGADRKFIFTLEETNVNKDQVKGRAKEVKGNIKEAAGKVVGNDKLKVEGRFDKAAGKAQGAYGDLKDAVKKKD